MRAWLAWVAHQLGDSAAALAHVQAVLDFMVTATLDGLDEPVRVCLLCAQVLRDQEDCRTANPLAAGRTLLEQRSALLTDTVLRKSYLELVPVHAQVWQNYPSIAYSATKAEANHGDQGY
jgi:hypothetical protein